MTSALIGSSMKPAIWFLLLIIFVSKVGTVERGKIDVDHYREVVKNMFYHAYNGYIHHAYPYDELRPLTCDGIDTWGSYSLTLIDALDTLAVMGNYSEFRRVCHLLIDKAETFFDMDINVSVFETNIRVVGGLLSAHLLMKKTGMVLEPGWPCSGPLLRMAEHVARKLLPAFDTPTGMPFGTVNLRHGVPKGETTITCTAGVGTFIVEFGALSRLTGDPVYEKVAMRAIRALWKHRSPIGLLGNHVDVATGKWTALDSGIGGGIDSYFEYLVKGAVMFNIPELLVMFREYQKHIETHVKRDDWYLWANMKKGGITLPLFTSLDAYWPGTLSMLGDLESAQKTLHNFHQVWRQFGSTPEFYNIPKAEVHQGREGYPLRPELIESIVYLYRATQDPFLLSAGVDIVEAIERIARTRCGYATVKDVRTHSLENRMESFFLAETAKYLYLLFDPDNFLHNNGSHGNLVHTPNGDCVVDTGAFIFNTEAHPLDLAAVHCCSAQKQQEEEDLRDLHDNLNLMELLDIVQDPESRIVGRRLKMRRRRERKEKGGGGEEGDGECGSDALEEEEGGEGGKDSSPGPVFDLPQGPPSSGGSKQDSSALKRETQSKTFSSSSSSSLSSSSSSLPQATIKTTVVKTATISTTEKSSLSESSQQQEEDSLEQEDSSLNKESSELGVKVNAATSHDSAGRQKHTIDLAQQILDLFSSISKPPEGLGIEEALEEKEKEEKRSPNVGDLYLSLANYSTVYEARPVLMRCPAQSFHHRLSVWGEMFDDEQ